MPIAGGIRRQGDPPGVTVLSTAGALAALQRRLLRMRMHFDAIVGPNERRFRRPEGGMLTIAMCYAACIAIFLEMADRAPIIE